MSKPRPAPQSMKDLDFELKPMTEWFDPRQLAATGLHALLSSVFGAYADKRELQAALDLHRPAQERVPPEYVFENGEFWMDYVADLGDGFNPTYTIASLLAKPALDIPYGKSGENIAHTKRGKVLVMGGDQVYPSATREEYRNRLLGPYEAALPWHDEPTNPHLYAIPGNHDWYDGLTSYMRLFCQRRWIGGWQTRQSRSYFAVRLPGPWWLWGLDLQLTSDVDDPQIKYFVEVAANITPGQRLIVCTPAPSWVKVGMGEPRAFDVLDFFLKRTVPEGVDISVMVSGDLHHYAHYTSQLTQKERTVVGHRFTAGGGGAYLYPTHNLPERIEIERSDPDSATKAKEQLELEDRVYPGKRQSRVAALMVIRFLRRNKQFALLLGAIYLLFTWVIEHASASSLLGQLSVLATADWPRATRLIWDVLWRSPATSVFTVVVVAGLTLFATSDRKDRWRMRVGSIVGALHGVSHIALAGALMWLVASLIGIKAQDTGLRIFLFAAGMVAAGTLAGGALMGFYLFVTNLTLKLHDNETFSSQGIPDYKNFLRFKFLPDGSLIIYPVAIDRVTRKWKANPHAGVGDPWIVPADGKLAECRLAEEAPIEISSKPPMIPTLPQSKSGIGARR